jgi:peptidoglycan/LPS O-acetylase OafA/YrhL
MLDRDRRGRSGRPTTLCHLFIPKWVEHARGANHLTYLIAFVAAVAFSSAMFYLIEKPLASMRKKLAHA